MSARWSAGRLVLLGAGLVLMSVGAVVGVTSVPTDQWRSVLLWLAGGVAVHDAALAPIAVVAGLVLLPRVPEPWRAALRGGALGAGVLAVFAVAVVGGAAHRRHESVVPLEPSSSLALAAGVLVGAVLLGALAGRRRARREVALRKLGRLPPPGGRRSSGHRGATPPRA